MENRHPLIEEYRSQGRVFLQSSEVQEIFRISSRTIRRWVDEGRLKALKPTAKHLITLDSVEQLLIESEVMASSRRAADEQQTSSKRGSDKK